MAALHGDAGLDVVVRGGAVPVHAGRHHVFPPVRRPRRVNVVGFPKTVVPEVALLVGGEAVHRRHEHFVRGVHRRPQGQIPFLRQDRHRVEPVSVSTCR
jgi:hypothetical protein